MSPLRKLIWPIYAPTIVFAVGSGAVAPMIVLAALRIGFSSSHASTVMAYYGVVGVVAAPLVGHVLLRTTDKRGLEGATAIAALSLGISLAALYSPGMLAKVGYVAGLTGIAIAASVWAIARQSYLADNISGEYRATALSMLGGMMRLGVMAGPALGTAIVAFGGIPAVFWLHLLTALLAGGMVAVFLVPASAGTKSAKKANRLSRPLRRKPDRISTAITAYAGMSMQIVRANRNVLIPLWGTHLGLSPTLISATFAISAALDVAMFYPAGRLQDRYGRLVAVLPAYLIMGTGFLGLVLFPGKVAFVLFASLVGFGNGFGSGIVMTMGVDMSPDIYRERFLGWWTAITQAGSAAGPLFVAGLTATVGLAGAMWATVAVAAVAALWAACLFPRAYRRLDLNTAGGPL
ncbi:hypothetical protein HMPREF3152_06435 [Actinomyces sp. HMSC06A08]|uniref:MFS transporter n=1 Tax=Winkia neuii TaxID=33007 RepID=A0A2I1IKB8_9ACTO|nr:MFS transporter [Winkia neuii]OFJ72612.1 hypothetical protein HMPREF2851_02700 [Actinomyces sp. HMSC064C12]OFK05031.1 hypothetical protein HMPREF2835_01135 [Actinomyces sp. HMSC072A03]OFT55337.1 hypothetical protein HMPREF3152_06435 [Actinomyces sp. HMSC06A08]PKY71532.1 MFS transporter [Winkia neuii]